MKDFSAIYLTLIASLWPSLQGEKNIALHGIGASFPEETYDAWALSFQAAHPYASVTYNAISSGVGECMIEGQCSDANAPYVYGGTDRTDSDEIYNQNHPRRITSFPVLQGAIAIVYNIPGVKLQLSLNSLIRIFSGNITHWKDTELQVENSASLPNEKIIFVARQGLSGTTSAITNTFSQYSEEWRKQYGVLESLQSHPNLEANLQEYRADGSAGVVGLVSAVPYTLGYLAYGEAIHQGLQVASIFNTAGQLVNPNISDNLEVDNHTTAALKSLASGNNLTESTKSGGSDESEYPLTTYTYILINRTTTPGVSCEQMILFVEYITWCLTSVEAHKIAKATMMVPISVQRVQKIIDFTLKKLTCENENVYEMMLDELAAEENAKNASDVTVFVVVAVTVLSVGLVIIVILAYYHHTTHSMLSSKAWLLNEGEVTRIAVTETTSDHGSILTAKTGDLGSALIGDVCLGTLAENPVILSHCIVNVSPKTIIENRKTSKVINTLAKSVSHPNIMPFVGLLLEKDCSVTCAYAYGSYKGQLQSVLRSSKYELSQDVRLALALDVATGMTYLHDKNLIHGSLNSINCYVNSGWRVCIGDWANTTIALASNPLAWRWSMQEHSEAFLTDVVARNISIMIQYTDPELLKPESKFDTILPKHDIYSFGVLLANILNEDQPRESQAETISMMDNIQSGIYDSHNFCNLPVNIKTVIQKCVAHVNRPTFKSLCTQIKSLAKNLHNGVVGILMNSMEQHMVKLEDTVAEKTFTLSKTTERMEHLLHELLPAEIAQKLLLDEVVEPKAFDSVAIFHSDIVGFTTTCSALTALQVVELMNHTFSFLDELLAKRVAYKVETAGDSYMAVSGLPEECKHHTKEIAALALSVIQALRNLRVDFLNQPLQMRIGVHSGPCVAGVVGRKMPRYCLFGTTVMTAMKLENTGEPMKIHASEDFIKNLSQFQEFKYQPRESKAMSREKTYWLVERMS